MTQVTHALERTSPKGEAFVGTCMRCGRDSLPSSAALEPCENIAGISDNDALLLAVAGPSEAPVLWTSLNEVTGVVARFAVSQSPYPVPERLSDVIAALHATMSSMADGFGILSFRDGIALEEAISKALRSDANYLAWNERKNGNDAPLKFTSRFDGPSVDPDDDFVDLDALERNVRLCIEREASRDAALSKASPSEGGEA